MNKREAIRLVDSGGRGIKRTARDLGISKSSLTRWISERRETDLLSGPHDDMQKELARLRRENGLTSRFSERFALLMPMLTSQSQIRSLSLSFRRSFPDLAASKL
jgi:transposase-like protein